MDAPVYLPSKRYAAPVRVSEPMSTTTSAILDFVENPAAKAIAISEIPAFEAITSNPALAPHLGNQTLRDMMGYGLFKPDALDRIDSKLEAARVTTEGAR